MRKEGKMIGRARPPKGALPTKGGEEAIVAKRAKERGVKSRGKRPRKSCAGNEGKKNNQKTREHKQSAGRPAEEGVKCDRGKGGETTGRFSYKENL